MSDQSLHESIHNDFGSTCQLTRFSFVARASVLARSETCSMADIDLNEELLQKKPSERAAKNREEKANGQVMNDKEALGNLLAYKNWMLAPGSWIYDRKKVEQAFDIIEHDIPVSVGANGDVENLVVGPALPYCYWCNGWTWSSFFIILGISLIGLEKKDDSGIYEYPSSGLVAFGVFGVFGAFTFRALRLEYLAAMYVLPSQAISSGRSLRKMAEEESAGRKTETGFRSRLSRITFNQWLVCMLIISFFFHLDICSTAVFIARVWRTRYNRQGEQHCLLDNVWQDAMGASFLRSTPMSWPYTLLVALGIVVMLIQLLYAMSYSVPLSPNLSNAVDDHPEFKRWADCWRAKYRWCRYEMADVNPDEVLNHPQHHAGKCIGDQGDWWDRPQNHFSSSKRLDDYRLVEHPPGHKREPLQAKQLRTSMWLKSQADRNEMADNYQMRLARHRRARVAVFNSMCKYDMGYGRAVQALVESGRMNLMQWQDDEYLKQSEQNWSPWEQIQEIRRTNIRFFLFALQAAFFPFFQITFYGIVASSEKDAGFSDLATAGSVIVSTLIGMKYLVYEVQSVKSHARFFEVARDEFEDIAKEDECHRRRWEAFRLHRRSVCSMISNYCLFAFFLIVYLVLIIKVVMVMLVCDPGHKVFNMPMPQDIWKLDFTSGCLALTASRDCKGDFLTNLNISR